MKSTELVLSLELLASFKSAANSWTRHFTNMAPYLCSFDRYLYKIYTGIAGLKDEPVADL